MSSRVNHSVDTGKACVDVDEWMDGLMDGSIKKCGNGLVRDWHSLVLLDLEKVCVGGCKEAARPFINRPLGNRPFDAQFVPRSDEAGEAGGRGREHVVIDAFCPPACACGVPARAQ